MTVRRCVPWPSAVLRTPAADVAEITDEVRQTWADMIDTMEAPVRVRTWSSRILLPMQAAPRSIVNHYNKRKPRITSAIGRLRGT